jgi:hypothetical protein
LGFGKNVASPQSMLATKDESIASWFNFFYINIFCILHIDFGPLNVDIAFGGQDAPKQP